MVSRENSSTCFCPSGTSLVDGRCAQIYSEGLRLSGFVGIERSNYTNSTNASSASELVLLRQQLTRSIALLYNISESLVQVVLTASTNQLQQPGYRADIIILSESAEAFASVMNKTATVQPPMIQGVQRTTLSISLSEGTIVLCGANEVSIGTTCVCSAGHTRKLGLCVGCAAGNVKAVAGDMPCEECSNNTFSRAGARQCSLCPFSSTSKLKHTSCSCNPAFVFFNDTCKETESVYLNVSGVLQLPEGEFNVLALTAIILDSMSAYLNFPKEFITIIISRRANITNETDTNLTNVSTRIAGAPTTGAPTTGAPTTGTPTPTPNTSNSTSNRRRLLVDLTLEYVFTALFQIEKGDTPTYAKIQNFTYQAKNEINTIIAASEYRIVINQADLTPGYFTAAGTALAKCSDGTYPTANSISKELGCKANIIAEVATQVLQATWGYWVVMGVGVLVLAVIIGIHYHRKGADILPVRYETLPQTVGLQRFCVQEFGMHTSKLQVPATVAIEYRLLPGQSI
jgi:hypothetical protein